MDATAAAIIVQADCLEWLKGQPDDSVDLIFGSPPYEDCRTYGIDFRLKGQGWVDWMAEIVTESVRVSSGLVAFVVEGKTKQFKWSATPILLMADLHRAGINLRKPPAFHRVGIPGSGGPDWLRNDWEFILCATSGGKLSWSDNTAMGHPPKYAPGGAMSHRTADGRRKNSRDKQAAKAARVNQWGHSKKSGGTQTKDGKVRSGKDRPSYREVKQYDGVTKANPGNVIKCVVGGGCMGSKLAHENEAPFPLSLAEHFVRSFCEPGGIVCDPFSGSGTTGHAAIKHGRKYIGIDVRESQVELTKRRLREVESK